MVLPRHIKTEEHTEIILHPNRNHDVKYCPTCKQDLPISEFYRNRAKNDGLSSYCKEHSKNHVTKARGKQENNDQATE